jgi:Icc-related predicted phosphoesterase
LVIVSDTHTRHQQLDALHGDVLLHCGDMCNGFEPDARDLESIDRWFARQEFELILCTGGNHDFVIEERAERGATVFQNATYLAGETIEFGGLKFFAAPWIPKLESWAYFCDEAELEEKWNEIPDNTSVLITHTPPFGILDRNRLDKQQGCPLLRTRIKELASLQLHAFGHIHESHGRKQVGNVQFINAALQTGKLLRDPIVVDL